MRILLTGATGYVGGRLAPRLIAEGHELRCLARDPARLAGRPWGAHEVVAGDVSDSESLRRALDGCDAAYYLVHSMTAGEKGFEDRDRACARIFADAVKSTPSLRRIIYLGGLGGADRGLSSHLESRQEVGEILRGGGVPVTEFRAAVVVGSGSASFEMIRCLTERVPVMICPALGVHALPAHRHPRCPAVSHRRAVGGGVGGTGAGDRRNGCADLSPDDGAVRRSAEAAPLDHQCAGADAAPVVLLGGPGHARYPPPWRAR